MIVTLSADKYAKFAIRRPRIGKTNPTSPTQRKFKTAEDSTPTQHGGTFPLKKGGSGSRRSRSLTASLWPSVELRLINAGFSADEARTIANLRYTSLIASCATS